MKTISYINPDRVDLVRRRLGLTKIVLSSKLDVDRKLIQRFENGLSDLPDEVLTRLCIISGYKKEFFYKDSPITLSPSGVSFRSLKSLTSSSRNAAMAVGSLAFELDDWITERYDLPKHCLFQFESSEPVAAALYIRTQWGIGERPIGNMINLLEAHGIRIFSLAEETRHLDAYSLWRDNKPYIFLNTIKTMERTRMDAAHELGHLVMHRNSGALHPTAEHEAKEFASAFLMPPNDLKAEFQWVRSLSEIVEKKKRWGVSTSALNYALHKVKRISDWSYRTNCISLAKNNNEELAPMAQETSQIWGKILMDLWQQGVTISHIADHLHIPEKEINSILFGIASKVGKVSKLSKLHIV